MKCPNCGAEMKEGTLYCEKCGEDIHIVPDFEPELEQNIVRSLEPAIREATAENGGQEQPDGEMPKPAAARRPVTPVLGWVGIALLVVALIGAVAAITVRYSSALQAQLAQTDADNGDYEKAVAHYQRAIELEPSDVSLLFELADVYFRMNDKEQYAAALTDIIDNPYADASQIESAYGKLIAVYKAQGDYQSINDMLLACSSDSIRALYESYIPQAPEFSIPAGSYDTVKALMLTASGDGTIYYTTDGSEPGTGSEVYGSPILLEDGSYRIRAVYVDENGISSEIAEADYQISVEEIDPPVLNLESGEYNLPVSIEVTGSTENVYYTTDGTTPTQSSRLYTEPIPLAPGMTRYRFARIQNGVSSSVEERVYTLELLTDLTPERAEQLLMAYQYDTGKLQDTLGHYNDTEAVYSYVCRYALRIGDEENHSDYYVIAEVLTDVNGNSADTGNLYAVDAYAGTLYTLHRDGNGNNALTELPEAVTPEQE